MLVLKLLHLVIAHARHEHLLDVGFGALCRLTQALGVGGHGAQMHQLQSLALYLLDHHAQYLLLLLRVFWQEHQSGAILSLLGNGYALEQDKLMGNLNHDARAVAVLADFRSAVPHVLQYLKRIVHQFVALVAVDVHYHSHTTGIMFIRFLVESSFLVLKFAFCHIILFKSFFLLEILGKGKSKCYIIQINAGILNLDFCTNLQIVIISQEKVSD